MITKIKQLFNSSRFEQLTQLALEQNHWFTLHSIEFAKNAIISQFLDETKVNIFCSKRGITNTPRNKDIGVVCAGNIPFVGFGDMFYALISGCRVKLKPSSKDPLMHIFDELAEVEIVESIDNFTNIDAILIMGSDSTCQLIESKYPNTPILSRGSMHSIAILDGTENKNELNELTKDMLLHSSMGCRSVTELFVPTEYNFTNLASALSQSKIELPKPWKECYNYQKALRTLKGEEFIDCEHSILTPHKTGQLAVFSYKYYSNTEQIDIQQVQHIATKENFGTAQCPSIEQFANKENVIDFIYSL